MTLALTQVGVAVGCIGSAFAFVGGGYEYGSYVTYGQVAADPVRAAFEVLATMLKVGWPMQGAGAGEGGGGRGGGCCGRWWEARIFGGAAGGRGAAQGRGRAEGGGGGSAQDGGSGGRALVKGGKGTRFI